MKRTIALLSLLFPVVAHAQLPPPNHPITFGYYYADKPQYGDYRSATNCYTDSYYLLVKGGAQRDSTDPVSVWFPKMQQQIADAVAAGKNVHVNLGFEDPDFITIGQGQIVTFTPLFGQVLDALAPYWSSVVRIELADEPSWGSNRADAVARAVGQELDSRGMARKPMGIVLGRGGLFRPDDPGFSNPLHSAELSWIGAEAYLCAPGINCYPDTTNGNADSATNIAILNNFLGEAKSRIVGSGKDVVLVMQAYTLSYSWDPWLSNVTDMQTATYLQAYNDPRVTGINMFAYGRPDGTVAHPEFQNAHKQIATALYGSLPPGCNDPVGPIAPPSNLRASAQQFRVNLTWNDNSSNEAEFRVQRMDNNSGVWNLIASVGANSTSYSDNTPVLPSGGAATYSYRVRARNGTAASDFSNVATVVLYGDLPAVPVLIAPSGCISTVRPVFSWNATPRANDYYIAVTRADIESFFVNQPGVIGTTYNLSSDLLIGVQYRWKVKACNNLGCGGWAPSVYFKTYCSGVASTITAPLGCIATQRPTFIWNPIAGATDYWLLVANSPDFSATTTTWYVNVHTTATSYYPGVVFAPNVTYYAKVKTLVAPGSTAGGWSATISFTPLCPDSSPR